jgi:CBS domain-containing protein
MHVRAILDSKGGNVVTAGPQETIATITERLDQHRIGAVVVVEAEQVAGILSERDIVRGLAKHGAGVTALKAADLMTHPVRTCGLDDTIDTVMQVMTQRRFRHVPIVEDGKLLGIVSIGDVVKRRLELSEMEVSSLRQYVLEGH